MKTDPMVSALCNVARKRRADAKAAITPHGDRLCKELSEGKLSEEMVGIAIECVTYAVADIMLDHYNEPKTSAVDLSDMADGGGYVPEGGPGTD